MFLSWHPFQTLNYVYKMPKKKEQTTNTREQGENNNHCRTKGSLTT